MLFLTYWFVLFIAVLYPLYWFCPRASLRRLILLVGSAVFHTHFAGPAGVLPVIILGTFVYLVGLTRWRGPCYLGIAASCLSLVYYKYTTFLATRVLVAVYPDATDFVTAHEQQFRAIAAPLAISFFVFEFVHYLIDVCRGDKPIRNPFDFALFAVFWPSIVAGPVKRYQHFFAALHCGTTGVNSQDVAVGLVRVAIGLVKKFAADNLTSWIAFTGATYAEMSIRDRWVFLAALSLRILWDFSGYSDMAIGFARMHGIRLPANFRWPYLAASITSFWRRWHISLSLWIRDYIYVVLGGNRHGVIRKVANGLIAFAICGLWHGAGWNFLLWGLYHGIGLAVASTYRGALGALGRGIGRVFDRAPFLGWALTLVFVAIGWLLFFYPAPEAVKMARLLFVKV
jgi:alginate O-acetyltransferase complex protein AlgI